MNAILSYVHTFITKRFHTCSSDVVRIYLWLGSGHVDRLRRSVFQSMLELGSKKVGVPALKELGPLDAGILWSLPSHGRLYV